MALSKYDKSVAKTLEVRLTTKPAAFAATRRASRPARDGGTRSRCGSGCGGQADRVGSASAVPTIAGAKPFALVLKLLGLTSSTTAIRGRLAIKRGATVVQTGTQQAVTQWLKQTRQISRGHSR